MGLQQSLGDLAALVAGEVAGLAGDDHHVGRLGLDLVVEALLAVVGGGGADGAFELDDLALAAGLGDGPVRHALAFLDEVRADESEVVLAALGDRLVEVAVDGEHGDAGLAGVEDGGGERLLLARREEDEVDALGDHAVDVGDLLGGGAGGVGVDELVAALGSLVLHALRLGETPRVVALRLGEADLVVVLFLQRRDLAEGGIQRERRAHADGADKHMPASDDHRFLLESARQKRVRTAFRRSFPGL